MTAPAPRLRRLTQLARELGLPVDWLRKEAEAGRLPHLNAGGVLRFDRQAVEQALLERAGEESTELREQAEMPTGHESEGRL